MLIPAVSVLTAITLLPALLAVMGEKINRLRLLPRLLMDKGHPEDGFWGRWANTVIRHPRVIATIGLVIIGVLVFYCLLLNRREALAKMRPGSGVVIVG